MSQIRGKYNNAPISVGNGVQTEAQFSSKGILKTTAGDPASVTVTHTLDTSAYASGDLIADTQAIAGATDVQGGYCRLDSVTILDEDDQGVALWLVFSSASTSFGTENSAPNISDANARNVLGAVPIATTDYVDIGGAKVACLRNIGLTMKAASSSTTLYVAIVNSTGTPTYTATGLQATYTFSQF